MCLTLCNPMDCSTPGFPVLHYLPELVQTHVHWVADVIHSSHSLSSPTPPAFSLSQHQGFFFQWLSPSLGWPKFWSFSFNISPSNEYSGLISFRIDSGLILQPKGLSSLVPNHSSKASILWCSAFFMVQLSHSKMPGKIIALTIWTFVSKVMSLLFNTLSRMVIAFLQGPSIF